MTLRERWAFVVLVLLGSTVGAALGWLGYDGVDVEL